MSTTIKNIANTTFNSFADSKWSNIVVFDSKMVPRQLNIYNEI